MHPAGHAGLSFGPAPLGLACSRQSPPRSPALALLPPALPWGRGPCGQGAVVPRTHCLRCGHVLSLAVTFRAFAQAPGVGGT